MALKRRATTRRRRGANQGMACPRFSTSAPTARCSRSCHTPRTRFHSHHGTCAGRAHPAPSSGRNIFFPVRPFFLQWRWAVTDFHPAHRLIGAEARLIHIAKVFALGDGTHTESFALDSVVEVGFAAGFYTSSDQITHEGRRSLRNICSEVLRRPQRSDKHLVLGHGPPRVAAPTISASTTAKQELDARGYALNHA